MEGKGEGTRNILKVILRQWMYGGARKQDKDEGSGGVRKELISEARYGNRKCLIEAQTDQGGG